MRKKGKVLLFTLLALISFVSLRDKEIVLHIPVPEIRPESAEAGDEVLVAPYTFIAT